MPGSSSDMYKTSCLSFKVNRGSNKINMETPQTCSIISASTVSGNQCVKNLTTSTCISFTPGEKICISLENNMKVRMKFNCTQEHPVSICNDTGWENLQSAEIEEVT
ncbi:unnamed protein product [Oreochromis niloticus]|nr:unnamed protein product [Mustela putorius furo]